MKTKKQWFYIESFSVNTESDQDNGNLLDTQIFIDNVYICTIEGVYIVDFVTELRNLINKYKI